MMDFFEAVKIRRSVRRFTAKPVPAEVVTRAIDAALLAPNSSNMQTWEFFWVKSPEKKEKLVQACLSQSAAGTAQELVVVVANLSLWKQNQKEMIKLLTDNKGPKFAFDYYGKLIPFVYGFRFLAPIKFLMFNLLGLFRPMMRRPWSTRDLQEVAIKSAALASENLMLAISAQGYGTCPREGFDERRVKKLMRLNCRSRVVMVIGIGEPDPEKGIFGPQIRFNRDRFVHEV